MERSEAFTLIKNKIKTKNLINHSLAVEAVMRRLAQKFGEDVEKWGLAGLLHDIDYEETKDIPEKHSLIGSSELKSLGLENDIVQAVKLHNDYHGLPRKTKLDKALYSVDPITGLIVASALVLPDKKLSSLSRESVLRRFKEKTFAKGASRETISSCRDFGLRLDEFTEISLKAMQEVASEIGL